MVECEYCDVDLPESDDYDQDYLDHLVEEHPDELTKIDYKMLENHWEGDVDEIGEETYQYSAFQIAVAGAMIVIVIGLFATFGLFLFG